LDDPKRPSLQRRPRVLLDSSLLRQGADALAEDSPFRFIAEKGLESANKHTGLSSAVDFNTWTTQSIQRAIGNVQSRMQDGLAVLATVGSTSPFVGLLARFGTVQRAGQDRYVWPSLD
jgi:biopolymer transport protein ExbB